MDAMIVLAFGAFALGLIFLGVIGWADERIHGEDRPALPEPERREAREE